MNDLFYVKYEARLMLLDSMDMSPKVELAHRRLCDFIWTMDGAPDDEPQKLRDIGRIEPADYAVVRAGLERKGWHTADGKFVHNAALSTLTQSKEDHQAACERTRAATEARKRECAERNEQRNVDRNDSRNANETKPKQQTKPKQETKQESERDHKHINDAHIRSTVPGEKTNRASLNRSKELRKRLQTLLGEDEMARAGGYWMMSWVKPHPGLVEAALGEMECKIREGDGIENRGAWLTDLLKRWNEPQSKAVV